MARKVTFVCFHIIFRHRQQTETGECRVLDINASILRIYSDYKKCQFLFHLITLYVVWLLWHLINRKYYFI